MMSSEDNVFGRKLSDSQMSGVTRSTSLLKISEELQEENLRDTIDLRGLDNLARRQRMVLLPVPAAGVPEELENLQMSWEVLGCFVSQQRFKAMDNVAALEWISSEGRRNELWSFVFHEFNFARLDIELAFRLFLERLGYVPAEGTKQARLIAAFATRYNFDCPEICANADAATSLASGLFMIHTMLHNVRVNKDFAFDLESWIEHNQGLNNGGDWDTGMLADAFSNVRDAEFLFLDDAQRMRMVKHGWVEIRELKGVGGSKWGSSIRSRSKPSWAIVVDGDLYFLRSPGSIKEAFMKVSLEKAVVHRLGAEGTMNQLSVALDYFGSEEPSGAKRGLVMSFRSPWAFRSWTDVLLQNVDRPWPGVPIHDVPAARTPSKMVRKTEYEMGGGAESGVHSRQPVEEEETAVLNPLHGNQLLPARKHQLSRQQNPLYRNESLEGILTPPSERVQAKRNPLYGNDELEEMLSPGRRLKEHQNPVYGRRSLDEVLVPAAVRRDRLVRFENPLFQDSFQETPNPLYAKRFSSPDVGNDIKKMVPRALVQKMSCPELPIHHVAQRQIENTPVGLRGLLSPRRTSGDVVLQENPLFGLGSQMLLKKI